MNQNREDSCSYQNNAADAAGQEQRPAVFSPAQKEAVTWGQGPLLVIAGPGSGKTFVITHRVRYLTETLGVRPSQILVVTFSRAAARSMEERYLSFFAPASGSGTAEDTGMYGVSEPGPDPRPALPRGGRVTFGTFHSFFFGLLRTAYGYSADQVAGDEERVKIVTDLIREYRIAADDIRALALNLIQEIALVKEERADLDHYYAVSCPASSFRDVFRGYERALGELRKIDYEDMLLMTYELLRERADIRRACQERWQWVLVDEFQDINRLQYEIIRMIAGDRKNLTIVGDDDQSIYRFRGAKPEIMLGFTRDYPEAKQVILDINFRSTPEIVGTAGRLIRHNKRRFKKEIRASRPSGKPVNTVVCPDPAKEADYIAREIKARVLGIGASAGKSDSGKNGTAAGENGTAAGTGGAETAQKLHYSDIAILYRTNLQPRLLAAKLMAEGIPFRMKEMLPDLMDHWIAKDIRAYLRLARGIGDRADLVRIMNRPNRYIRRDAVRDEDAFRDGAPDFAGIARWYFREGQGWMKERLDKFAMELRALSRRNVYDAIRYLREEVGYDDFLKSYAEEHHIELNELREILEEVMDSAEGFQFPEDWFEHCREFREELLKKKESGRKDAGARDPRSKDAKGREEEDTDQVHLMTFHASKGLEFPLVYLVDVNEGIVPHRKAGTREELEEERRMFYVAMTRAKDELQICTCRKRFQRAAEESTFIEEYERG